MLKFKGVSIDTAEESINTKLRKMIKDPILLNELGDVMIKDIKFTARKGVNPITGEKFIPLSKQWIREREKISQSTPVNDAFKPTRSNITLSGQLLDSIRKSAQSGVLKLFFDGIHNAYQANYLTHYVRRIKKRSVRLNKGQIQGLQSSFGGIQFVNTNRNGKRKIGKDMSNEQLAQHVNKIRPFFYVREKLLPQLKTVVIRYIRRNL